MRLLQVEWVGGWMAADLMGPWPAPSVDRPVWVLLLGPLYVSMWPSALAEGPDLS